MDWHHRLDGMALTYMLSPMQQTSGVNVSQVCIHVKRRLSEYLILLQITHMYISCVSLAKIKNELFLLCYIHQNFSTFEFYISQGSAATYVRCGGKRDMGIYCKFLAESNSERIVKIGQRLPELCLRLEWNHFLTHTVFTKILTTARD